MTTRNHHKIECLKSIKLLSKNLKIAEKDTFSNILNIKNDKEFQAAFETHLTNESKIKNEKIKLAQAVRQISQKIIEFKRESQNIKPSQDTIESLKVLMETIDSSVSDFKHQHVIKYDELSNDEKLLTKEIEIYDKKIQNWSNCSSNAADKENNAKPNNDKLIDRFGECDLLKEVIDFDKYLLQNGGHSGGWDQIDHNLFLKIRNKHKAKQPDFFNELERLIATKTSDQIVRHEDWYQNYLNLIELKKEAIKKWRESKKIVKTESVSLAEAEIKLNQEIEKELRNRLRNKEQMEKYERNKQLNQWRLEREIKKAQQLEAEKLKEKQQYEKEYKEKLKQLEIKENLEEYKKQKLELNEYIEMEQYIKEETQRELRKQQAKYGIINFQQRDLANVHDKLAKSKAKEMEKEEKERRLEKQKEKFDVAHDPSRLYQPTSTWKNRVNTPRSDSGGPILTSRIPHLAIPSWRQGV